VFGEIPYPTREQNEIRLRHRIVHEGSCGVHGLHAAPTAILASEAAVPVRCRAGTLLLQINMHIGQLPESPREGWILISTSGG